MSTDRTNARQPRASKFPPACGRGGIAAVLLVLTVRAGGQTLTWSTIDAGAGATANQEYQLAVTIGQCDATPPPPPGQTYRFEGGFWVRPPEGRCCALGDGGCLIVEAIACTAEGGVFAGDYTDCSGDPCEPAGSGEDCAEAIALAAGTYALTTADNTPSAVNANCAVDPGASDEWYIYTAPVTGTLVVELSSAVRLGLEIFDICGGTLRACTAPCMLIAGTPDSAQSAINLAAGQSCVIRVGGVTAAAAGDFTLTLRTSLPRGACCVGFDTCAVVEAAACAQAGGIYHGDNVACPTVCPAAGPCVGAIVGDANGDGIVDANDLDAFVFCLAFGFCPAPCGTDANSDGQFNNFDIEPFCACHAIGGCRFWPP